LFPFLLFAVFHFPFSVTSTAFSYSFAQRYPQNLLHFPFFKMSSLKNELSSVDYEVEAQDAERRSQLQSQNRLLSIVHNSRIALTVLALAAGITILGVSANGLLVYHETYLPADFYLSLWPAQFDLRPTAALIAGGVIVTVANVVSLFFSKIQAVSTCTWQKHSNPAYNY
jgi:hypothetical protein